MYDLSVFMIAGLLGGAQSLAKQFVYTAANARKNEIRIVAKGKHCLGNERPTQAKYEISQSDSKVHSRHRTEDRVMKGLVR